MYRVDQSSLAKYEEAKEVNSIRAENAMTEEDVRDSEINALLCELQTLEKEELRESEINAILSELQTLRNGRGLRKDPTHHNLRAGVVSVANRFCIEQSKVGVSIDCLQ